MAWGLFFIYVVAMVLGVVNFAFADPIGFSSDFSGTADWNWDATSGVGGTGEMTVNPNNQQDVLYSQVSAGFPTGGDTDAVIDYSFDLDISALIKGSGAGAYVTIFNIGANGNQGPNVNGFDGSRTQLRLANHNSQGEWNITLLSGGIFSGSVSALGGVLTLTEAQEGSLHFAGTLTVTDTTVDNSLIITGDGAELWNFSTLQATGTDFGADNIDSYSLGALGYNGASLYTGDMVFDNFNVTLVPEPSTGLLLLGGLSGLIALRRRSRK